MPVTRPSLIERALRKLVRLLPEDFRYEFGGSIEADIADRRAAGDRAGLVRRDLPSLVGAIAREHFSEVRQDVKYSLRMMRRTPGFTALAILMLALGTGVNVAMFSIIDAVMLRSPFPDPDRIVVLMKVENNGRTQGIAPAAFDTLAASAVPRPFAAIGALWGGAHVITGAGDPFVPDVECVSPAMFDVLGTPPLLGRPFAPFDDQPGSPATMVVSYEFWQRLGASPSTIGSTVTVNSTPVTIVGVMPRGFLGALSRYDTDAWLPLSRPLVGGGYTGCNRSRTVNVFARLQPGMTIEAARARLRGVDLITLHEKTFDDYRASFLVLSVAVACVLLIACFNVGGLQMERMLARRREMALRVALGASRGRLIRHTLTENILLGLIGTTAGVLATPLILRAAISVLPRNVPHLNEVALDGRALLIAVAAAIAAGAVAGLLPVALTRRADPAQDLAGSSRASGRHRNWTRQALVFAEVALSIAVLIGAGLMIRTFLTLKPTSPGFDASRKTTMLLRLPGATPEEAERFFAQLLTRLETTPGIRQLAGSSTLPMRGTISTSTTAIRGTPTTLYTNYITPNYLDLLKIPIRMGRSFAPSDTRTSSRVAIVNELLAERIRPGGRVVGEHITVNEPLQPNPIDLEIVGVVANTRIFGSDTRSRPELFIPFVQASRVVMIVTAESDGRNDMAVAEEMRAAVRAMRPDLVIEPPEPMSAVINLGVRSWRSQAWLLGVFAGLAVLLAAIGLMTTIGWWVHQRTRELGVRMALGATRATIARLVFRQGLALAGLGIAGGLGMAALLTRYLQSELRGVTPLDPSTFVTCAAVMLLISIAAIYIPVRRATSVDPVIALRAE